MAQHELVHKWYTNSEQSTGVGFNFAKTLGFTVEFKKIPSYATISSVLFSVDWKTSVSSSEGDLHISIANNIDEANDEKYLWSATYHTKGSYKTCSSPNLAQFFVPGASERALFYLYFHATWARNNYYKNGIVTVKYSIPDITYTYKDWNGTVINTQTVEQGTSPTPPADPTRAADAQYTYTFSGWSLSGTTYTAQYTAVKRSYTITANTDGNGTVTGGGTYEYGKTATLTAVPNAGYKFKQWSDGNTSNPRTVTVTGAASYTAEFEPVEVKFYVYRGSTRYAVKAYVGTSRVQGYVGTKRIF